MCVGPSMLPTFNTAGDVVILDRTSQWLRGEGGKQRTVRELEIAGSAKTLLWAEIYWEYAMKQSVNSVSLSSGGRRCAIRKVSPAARRTSPAGRSSNASGPRRNASPNPRGAPARAR